MPLNPRWIIAIAFSLFVISFAYAPNAHAVSISYLATDLVDTTTGQDLYRYDYKITGFTFLKDFGFSIQFDTTLYSNLQNPPPQTSPDWDSIVLQPDPLLPSDGLYDALALVDNPTLMTTFTVEFIWLGPPGTLPGAQSFSVNQFDAAGSFIGVVDGGMTLPVPEPTTGFLLLFGLAGLRSHRRSR